MRITCGSHFKCRPTHSRQRLSPRLVDRRFNLGALACVFRISSKTNNLDLAGVVSFEAESLTNRVFIWKISLRERLIDYGHARLASVVLCSQTSARQQWDFHGREEVLTHCVDFGKKVWGIAVWSNHARQVH